MTNTKKNHKPESAAVRPVYTGMQVFPPTTPLTKNGVTRVTMPRESRDVRYIRYIDQQTGVIQFIPADMAGPEGIRYRRVRDRATGIVTLTPIRTKRVEETS